MAETVIEQIENYGLSKKERPRMQFSKIGLVGCGTVGQNIARMISCQGIEVSFVEVSEEKVKRALAGISRELDSVIEHWGMTSGEKRAAMSRITGHVGYENLRGCDLVIEAIRSRQREERISCRKEVFRNVEKYIAPDAIIATNSTTIAITELSSDLEYKDRCVSLHFHTTPPDSRLVELARGLYTSDSAYERVMKFIRLIKKEPIPVEESPGLVSVRLFVPLINEACEVLLEGVASKEDIDKTMKVGLGLTLGPFEMADKIGLDKVLRWMDNLYAEYGDLKYKSNPVIKKLVRAHQLGRISSKGFYDYDEAGRKISKQVLNEIN